MSSMLRRSGPWLLAVVVLAEQGTVLRNRDSAWVGDPLWGQETIGIAQVLVLPVVAATAAVGGWQARQGLLSLLGPGTPRLRHVANLLLSWWIPLGLAFGIANAVVVLVSRHAEVHLANSSPWPLVTQLCSVLAATCGGLALGYWASSWTGAVAATAVFALLPLLGRMGSLPNGFDEFSASGSMVGARPHVSFFATRVLWLVITGAGFLLAAVSVRGRWRTAGISMVVCTGALGLLLFAADHSYGVGTDPTHCSHTPVVVCGPAVLRKRVDEGGAAATRVSDALSAWGIDTRSRFVMWSAATSGQDTLMLVNPARFRDPLNLDQVVDDVVAPQSCSFWRDPAGPPDASVFRAVAVLHGAVMAQLSRAEPSGDFADFLARVPADEQRKALALAGDALQRCRPNDLDPTFDESARRP